MAISQRDVYNAALLKVSRSIVSAVDDGSYEANTCNALYPKALNSTLYDHAWNSCKQQAVLNPLTEAPAHGFAYAFQMPNDLVRVIQCYKSTRIDDYDFRWDIYGRTILTNVDALYLKYIYRPPGTEGLSPGLIDCLAHRLAMELVTPLQLDRAEAQALLQEYLTFVLPHAKAIDSMENRSMEFEESPWVESMNGLGPVNRGGIVE